MSRRTLLLTLVLCAVPAVRAQNAAAPAEQQPPASASEPARGPVPDIEVAYRAYASGELEAADRVLTELIERQPSPAAYLLRGCTRYSRSVLTRNGGGLQEAARADIVRAYRLNPALWLDPARFSPKILSFVDSVRREQQ
jgi:hypothetical protein